MDSGLDSLGAVEFRSSLESKLSLQLPPTLVFDFPTLSAIVGYLDTTLAAQLPGDSTAVASTSTAVPTAVKQSGMQQAEQIVAISAIHGNFPEPAAGVVNNALLRDVISVIPLERYDCEVQLTGDRPARFGGFLAGVQVRRVAYLQLHQRMQMIGS